MLRLATIRIATRGSSPLDHGIVSLAELLGPFSACFARPESFAVFQPLVAAWTLCLWRVFRKKGLEGHRKRTHLVSALNPEPWSALEHELVLPKGKKTLRVQTLRGVLWYHARKQKPVTVALIHDPAGEWRDEVLLSTRVSATAAEMIVEYGKRWSVELAFHDSKQYLGLEDPEVRTPPPRGDVWRGRTQRRGSA